MSAFELAIDDIVERIAQRTADIVVERLEARRNMPPARAGSDEVDLLDVTAAARRLGMAKSTLYKKANSGEVPSVKVGGRRMFRPRDLDEWVEARVQTEDTIIDLAARLRS